SLRNDSGRPLAIGPDRPLPSTLAVLPSLQVRGQRIRSDGPISLDTSLRRRFFLPPGESIDLDLAITPTRLGRFLEQQPDRPIAVVLRAVLDPRRSTTSGEIIAGPRGTIRDTTPFARNRLGVSASKVDAWIEGVDSPEPRQRFDSLAGLAVFLSNAASLAQRAAPGAGGDTTAPAEADLERMSLARQRAIERVATVWTELADPERAWFAVHFIPPAASSDGMDSSTGTGERPETLETIIKRSNGPLTRMVSLVTRTEAADDPFLSAALRSDDARVRELASHIATLLGAQNPDADRAADDETK
ncbi:MAG: hypothetical protein ACOC0P_05780, partial [Planctomycetota bacterium]